MAGMQHPEPGERNHPRPRSGRRGPVELDPRRAFTLLARALVLRCPNCGGRPLFRRWIHPLSHCPRCHLLLDRGEVDHFLGSLTLNFIVAELLLVAGAGVGILLTWPEVPWRDLTLALFGLVAAAPLVSYPWSKTLWLAVDLIFRPLTFKDLAGHGENLPQSQGETR